MASKLTENYIFRKFVCGLSKERVAELCFKSVRTVTRWDSGHKIPPECRRLMKLYSCRDLAAINDDWRGWQIKHGELVTPNGWTLTPDRIVTGSALLQISAENDREMKATIIKTARMLNRLPSR
ncbi:DUF3653 domain-containing protein [Photobacterium rosenbergii]|uniref:DUF3653 domain-containing protein n=1 Tax=Photobacterium rosenbergii TaxID=294936 RepID=A0ABU3ZFD8_9GAMM|nr:DUF3653 domain-containing protein [Photobacterium rosenbergii]MDV5168816.1 DUF3653 domain-containing protein [Photobacterium rosenbergii]